MQQVPHTWLPGNYIIITIKTIKQKNWQNTPIDVSVQDCSNSIGNALELLQSGTKPLTYIA